ncbi:MAG: hypothetical protein ACO3JL_03300 [Myxococcota bacterium]
MNAPGPENAPTRRDSAERHQKAIDRAAHYLHAQADGVFSHPNFAFSVGTVIIDAGGEETVRFETRYKVTDQRRRDLRV